MIELLLLDYAAGQGADLHLGCCFDLGDTQHTIGYRHGLAGQAGIRCLSLQGLGLVARVGDLAAVERGDAGAALAITAAVGKTDSLT